MSAPLDELAASLGSELGAIAARIERDLRLQFAVEVERGRAERAEFQLKIERDVSEKLAARKDDPPPPVELPPLPELHAPDDVAMMVGKALAMLAEAPAIAAPQPLPPVVNVTVPQPAPRTERTRVTKHDEHGRIVEIERDVA